jgi:hypothetical protein
MGCEYKYDGNIHRAKTKDACAKLKAGYQKYLKENNMDNAESRLKRNRSTTNGTDFQEKKKKKTKLQQMIKSKLAKRKALKNQKQKLDSIRGQKRRGFDGKWN